MRMKNLTLLTLSLWLITAAATAQKYTEMGSQNIINYTPKEYNAQLTNWAIVQDKRGVMYFGNQQGLLEFDGSTWLLYLVPNKSVVRSLANSESGKIYAGANGDLGFFQPDSSGKMIFS